MKLKTRIAGVLAAVALSAGSLLVAGQPAQAATGEELCSDFSYSQQWATSTRWGRVSYQICAYFTPTTVQPRLRTRFDWPVPCTLEISFPKPVPSGKCPLPLAAKNPEIQFQVNEAGYAFASPWRVTAPNGGSARGTCTNKNRFTVSSAIAQGVSRQYLTCYGNTYTRTPGRWVVGAEGIRGDVLNDGRGLRILASASQGFIS